VPVGLIVNEAVTNALKHAFPDGGRRGGAVEVRLRRAGAGGDGRRRLRLEVADDGVAEATGASASASARASASDGAGVRDGDAPRAGGGHGRRLIDALARQLGGSAAWGGPPGTTLAVEFAEEAGPPAIGGAAAHAAV
jgi:two-component sensor histidine kinase